MTSCCSSLWGTATKKQKVPHKSVWIARKVPHISVLIFQKVPHKNVIYFAILLFFSLLRQEYNNNTMNILRRWCRIATFLMAFKEHYILDIKYRDKAIEIIETLFPGYLTPRRKSSETDGREYLWTLCLFFGLLTTILCCHDNFSTVLRSISPLHLLVFAATKLCHGARNR